MWVPVTTAWHVLHMWMVDANLLNKQPQTADGRWTNSSSP